jgi:hypothetical protein
VKKILAAAAIASLAGMAACTANPSSPDTPTPTSAEPASSSQVSPSESSPPDSAGAKGACELFNKLFAEYAAVSGDDPNPYEDIYLKAEDAKDTVSGDLRGLFAALSLLAIDHSTVASDGGQPEQASKDAIRDAVFANAGTCTAEGVTLRL